MPILEANQRTDSWLDARKGKITASVAAGCLGLSPYMSRQEAWRTIVGCEKKSENNHMRWGTEFEPAARAAYEIETGGIVEETGFWVHPTIEWLGASPDGLVGRDGLVELKCPGQLPVMVPIHHRIQMLVQIAVTGRKWCDYVCFLVSGETFLRRVYLAGWGGILRKLDRFYRDHVLTGIEPPRKKRKTKKEK